MRKCVKSSKSREYLSVVELTINVNLSLCDVTGQIGDRMSDVIVRHGENGYLGNRTVPAFHTTSSFIDGSQISVHVTREATATRNLLSSSRHLRIN